MDEIVGEFLVETYEGLDQLDRDFVLLEQRPDDRDVLASVFRTIHTIKGTAGFLGFGRLEAVTHVGEGLMSRVRDGELALDGDITDALLALVDTVRRVLRTIETTGVEEEGSDDDLIERLVALREGAAVPAGPAAADLGDTDVPPAPAPAAPVAETPAETADATVDAEATDAEATGPTPAPARESAGAPVVSSTIRVDVVQLDRLMNLVGELVLARNQVLQCTTSESDAALLATSQRLNLITTELQEGVMKTRMQPIDKIWNKMPRIVRDVALACGKRVRLEMDGRETELDKTVLEAISDPLIHIVRNSIDHGIEAPDVRTAAGKPAEGVLRMRAFHEGGMVNIEISDDGGGINLARVKQRAIANALVSAEQAERLGERELANLIFLPGFSTAESVTNVSGRGVGMDVVKTNVDRIGGTLDMHTRAGFGTTLRIKIPLTLAIIPALVVTANGDRYAIPQVSLLEVVRLEGEQARSGIEWIHDAPVYRLRGNLLPLVHLDHELALRSLDGGPADVINVVVLQADERQFGLIVDEINDSAEIVVKPLGKHLKGISCFAGATIMGDGTIALILDVLGVARRAAVVSEASGSTLASDDRGEAVEEDRRLFLVVGVGGKDDLREVAVPLADVARLEEFAAAAVERAGGAPVVQYRGEILPLVDVARALGIAAPEHETLQVVVHQGAQDAVGLVVQSIRDVVDVVPQGFRPSPVPGIAGSALLQGRVTDLLDIGELVERHEQSLLVTAAPGA